MPENRRDAVQLEVPNQPLPKQVKNVFMYGFGGVAALFLLIALAMLGCKGIGILGDVLFPAKSAGSAANAGGSVPGQLPPMTINSNNNFGGDGQKKIAKEKVPAKSGNGIAVHNSKGEEVDMFAVFPDRRNVVYIATIESGGDYPVPCNNGTVGTIRFVGLTSDFVETKTFSPKGWIPFDI